MANDPTWRWDVTRSDDGVVVNAIDIDMPEIQPGASIDLKLDFWEGGKGTANPTGGTLGGATGFTLGGATGTTLGGATTTATFRDRYLDVRRYSRVAGRVSTQTTLTGAVRYRPRIPSSAPVNHVAVALRPSQALQTEETPGLWVVLDGRVDDTTRFINDFASITFSATVLDTLDNYPTRSDLENDLKT